MGESMKRSELATAVKNRLRTIGSPVARAIDRTITLERIRLYPSAVLAVSLLILIAMTVLGDYPQMAGDSGIVFPDYLAHWTAGQMVLDGNASGLYDPAVQHLTQSREIGDGDLVWFISPPFMALAYTPFALMSYGIGAAVWLVINLACLAMAVRLMRPFAPRLFEHHFMWVLIILASTEPVFELLGTGQDTGLTLLCWVGGIRLMMAKRDAPAGIVFALGLLKPQLFILVPIVLLVQRRFRALAAWAVTATILAAASIGLVGFDGVIDWLRVPSSNFYASLVQTTQAWKLEGLPSLVKFLFPPQWRSIGTLMSVFTAAAALLVFARQTLRAYRTDTSELGMWMLAILATCVASPHLFVYDLVIVQVPILYLVEHHNSRTVRLACVAAFVLTWISPSLYVLVHAMPWPLTIVSAAWTAIPLVVLWSVLARAIGVAHSTKRGSQEPSTMDT